MKILIDVCDLEKNGVITPQLACVLRTHAICNTGSAAIGIFLTCGVIAIAAGLLVLVRSSEFAAFLGASFILCGWLVRKRHTTLWDKIANIGVMDVSHQRTFFFA